MTTILQEIHEGMSVCDPSGDKIGTVEFVHLTDEDPATPGPEAATVSPVLRDGQSSLIDAFADVFRTDEIPETLRERLLRSGFVRIDASGLFAADRYVTPDQIASVSGDAVNLAVDKDQLVRR